tara:strand:+ start:116 stop:601 length:486 start_codon:yes stop_codon:yes gene_type:complete
MNKYFCNIRLLNKKDTQISYKWRNDSSIWTLTRGLGNYGKKVTLKDEIEWFNRISIAKDRLNLAIICNHDEYVGNIYFTNIKKNSAEFQIFIGNKKYLKKNIGNASTRLSLLYAYINLGISNFYLYVNKKNINAIKMYKKVGFKKVTTKEKDLFKMLYIQN